MINCTHFFFEPDLSRDLSLDLDLSADLLRAFSRDFSRDSSRDFPRLLSLEPPVDLHRLGALAAESLDPDLLSLESERR